jgi:ParB-like nuclease domain
MPAGTPARRHFFSTINKGVFMNTTPNTSVQPRLIAVSLLHKSPLNARRTTGKMGMDELKASLLSHGLLQNLVVTEAGDGRFLVIAGDQLLAIARDTLGDQWAQARTGDKKASLVEHLDRAFADPAKHGRTPEQVEKLISWLPAGMAFAAAPMPKPARTGKARKAA